MRITHAFRSAQRTLQLPRGGLRAPRALFAVAIALQTASAGDIGPLDPPCNRLDTTWAGRFGAYTGILSSTVGPDDSLVVSGLCLLDPDFDPGEGVDQTGYHETWDMFVTKLYADGSYAWTYTAGNEESDTAWDVAVAADHSIYAVGSFQGTVDFDPTDSVDTRTAIGDFNSFVVHLGPDGTYLGVMTFGYGNEGASASSVAVDSEGNILVVGSFAGTIDFDPGEGDDIRTSDWSDPFLTKFGPDGSYLWTAVFSGPGADGGEGVAVDALDNILITGLFRGTNDFDPGPGEDWHTATGFIDTIYITKLHPDGSYVWTRTLPADFAFDDGMIAVDQAGASYVTGYFIGTVDFDPTDGTDLRSSAGDHGDVFATKINGDGSYGWTYTAGGPSYDSGRAVAPCSDGRIAVVGAFDETVDFDPTAGQDVFTTPFRDVFVLVLDETGAYRHTTVITSRYGKEASTIVADSTDALWLTGTFVTIDEPVDFDPTCEVIGLMSQTDNSDPFLAKMVCLEPSADVNGDGYVDMHDWALLQACLTGEAWTTCGDGCAALDSDGDNDVDVSDYFMFLASFNGPTGGP